MRIGVNTLFLIPGRVGGTETYLRATLAAVAALEPDTRLVLFTNAENDPMFRSDAAGSAQVEFSRLNFRAANRFARILREQFELPGAVRRARVDVLWSPGYTAPYSCPCSQVVTIHDMQYKSHPEDISALARLATDVLVRLAVRRCSRIMADSAFSREEILRYTPARPETVDVVPLGVDPAFADRRVLERLSAGMPALVGGAGPYILCVANSYPHKNVHVLVRAFGRLCDKLQHRLVLVGRPGLGEATLQAAIQALAQPARITRLDYVPRERLIALYQGADAFVFPSCYEGFGLPVAEAMLAGTPVLTTRGGAIPEIGGDAVTYAGAGDIDDLAAKLQGMLAMDAAARRAMTARAAARAAEFTWARTARGVLDCLRRAVGQPASTTRHRAVG